MQIAAEDARDIRPPRPMMRKSLRCNGLERKTPGRLGPGGCVNLWVAAFRGGGVTRANGTVLESTVARR